MPFWIMESTTYIRTRDNPELKKTATITGIVPIRKFMSKSPVGLDVGRLSNGVDFVKRIERGQAVMSLSIWYKLRRYLGTSQRR